MQVMTKKHHHFHSTTRRAAAAELGALSFCNLGMTLGAVAPAQAQAQQTGGAETNMDGYRYDPGPDLPACTRGQVRLQISLPRGPMTVALPCLSRCALATFRQRPAV